MSADEVCPLTAPRVAALLRGAGIAARSQTLAPGVVRAELGVGTWEDADPGYREATARAAVAAMIRAGYAASRSGPFITVVAN